VQLEELLLDEPDNEDYQSLYNDVQEVRFLQVYDGLTRMYCVGLLASVSGSSTCPALCLAAGT
jgi:hypothetical protein